MSSKMSRVLRACKRQNRRIKRNRKRKNLLSRREQSELLKTPIKNYVWCPQCGRKKHLYKSEKAAELAIQYSADDMLQLGKKIPKRAYYCYACCGWHLTSKDYIQKENNGKKDI